MLSRDVLSEPWPRSKTVDPEEIARFTAMAEEWWNPDGKFRPIHKFNPVRCAFVVDTLARHFSRNREDQAALAGIRILDVGCGAGLLSEPLAERGAGVVGIDPTARNIEIARWHAAQKGIGIEYRHCLAEHVLADGECFDAVLNTEVVEHVADPAQLMKECSGLIKPGGILVVATINRTLRSFALAIVGAEYLLSWLPKGTHDWRRFLRPNEIMGMLQAHGLDSTGTTGVSFNPVTGRWRLSGDTSVNYMLVATSCRFGRDRDAHGIQEARYVDQA
jgi:2-polyprenyl-6-hydroxyphenyl methylase/3-demethylubiquinone-9 3-methyltransferase